MAQSDVLVIIAECGVALAGFASLISVFGGSRETLDFTRMLGMVKNSLTAAGFALLPFAPHALELSDAWIWRGSGTVFLVVHTVSLSQAWTRLARLRRAHSIVFARASYYTYPVGVLSILCLLAALLVPAPATSAGLYVCALLAVLSSAGVLFLSLFSSFIRSKIQ